MNANGAWCNVAWVKPLRTIYLHRAIKDTNITAEKYIKTQ